MALIRGDNAARETSEDAADDCLRRCRVCCAGRVGDTNSLADMVGDSNGEREGSIATLGRRGLRTLRGETGWVTGRDGDGWRLVDTVRCSMRLVRFLSLDVVALVMFKSEIGEAVRLI